MVECQWGQRGGPWEFNLRDLFRWCDLMVHDQQRDWQPGQHVGLIYRERMRSQRDKQKVRLICRDSLLTLWVVHRTHLWTTCGWYGALFSIYLCSMYCVFHHHCLFKIFVLKVWNHLLLELNLIEGFLAKCLKFYKVMRNIPLMRCVHSADNMPHCAQRWARCKGSLCSC